MSNARRKGQLELMPEYGGHVLWWTTDLRHGPVAPEELGLSAGLVEALRHWLDVWEGDAPSEWTEDEFYEAGRTLARRLADEVGDDFEVFYEPGV